MGKFNPRIIAFYLPQFHPFKENDEWWGKGFTEWTNVAKAKPLFKGHYQPRIPADLGFYDLRVPETRAKQAELAQKAGIYGFCYWHYWFGNGKQLLNRVFDEVIESQSPDFPLCLGWANHSWYSKTWDRNGTDKLLIEQVYGGNKDYIEHFNYVLKAFKDERYIKIKNKPIFFIYDPLAVPKDFINLWNNLAQENGFDGVCFIGRIKEDKDYDEAINNRGFSYVISERINDVSLRRNILSRRVKQLMHKLQLRPRNCYSYREAYHYFINKNIDYKEKFIPTLIPNWDHSPRSKAKGLILHDSTPTLWRNHIKDIFSLLKEKDMEENFVFLKSWNEWAEGNYMEPDQKWGHQYIDVLREEVEKY